MPFHYLSSVGRYFESYESTLSKKLVVNLVIQNGLFVDVLFNIITLLNTLLRISATITCAKL